MEGAGAGTLRSFCSTFDASETSSDARLEDACACNGEGGLPCCWAMCGNWGSRLSIELVPLTLRESTAKP